LNCKDGFYFGNIRRKPELPCRFPPEDRIDANLHSTALASLRYAIGQIAAASKRHDVPFISLKLMEEATFWSDLKSFDGGILRDTLVVLELKAESL